MQFTNTGSKADCTKAVMAVGINLDTFHSDLRDLKVRSKSSIIPATCVIPNQTDRQSQLYRGVYSFTLSTNDNKMMTSVEKKSSPPSHNSLRRVLQ